MQLYNKPFLNGLVIFMFYLNVWEISVKVSDVAMALSHFGGEMPLVEGIKDIKNFHQDMRDLYPLF